MSRRLGVAAVLAACVALLGGCVSIQAISSDQQEIVGKLRLTLTVCATGRDDGAEPGGPAEDHPGCSVALSNYAAGYPYPGDGDQYQLLFAIRVPVGTGVPETVSATPTPAPPAAGTIVARRNGGYEAALQGTVPAPAGTQWVGYLSDPYDFSDGLDDVPAQSSQVGIDLGLPPAAGGGPFVGPLGVRPVVGARQVLKGSFAANRPVDCGTNPFTSSDDLTVCIDSPTSSTVSGNPLPIQTRDFGIVGGNATASPGQTVSLPFNVRGAGALPAGLTAQLDAATTLPGAGGVAPSVPSAALANGSDARVTVPVAIPKTAGPGVFDVTLTGRLDNGQTRSTTAKLTVRDRQKPVVSKLTVKPKAFKAATKKKPKRGTNVSYALSEAASVRMVVERCSKYAKAKKKKAKKSAKAKRRRCLRFAAMRGATTKAGKAGENSFRFNGKVRGKRLKAGPYRLALTATDAAGNVGDKVRAAFAVRR